MTTMLRKTCLSLGLAAVAFAPALLVPARAHADGINFSLNVGDDDEAHFHFRDHRHVNPMIWKAAQQLREAKHSLWQARNDFNGHKEAAVRAINAALDELSAASERH
jgi:hypothetical protein